jgi:hypothetical protein
MMIRMVNEMKEDMNKQLNEIKENRGLAEWLNHKRACLASMRP